MTEYGKPGKPRSRLSTLPTLLGNPFGITTFPRPRLLTYFKMQEHERPNARPLDLKGLVTDVSGPQRKRMCRYTQLLSVLRTCVTKQTRDMRYSEGEPL